MITRILLPLLLAAAPLAAQAQDAGTLADAFTQVTGGAKWERIGQTPVAFEDHHPQGMVKIGDTFFLSTVRILERPEKYNAPRDGMDRSPGKGEGYLLKLDASGHLIGKVRLGEGDIYHPGGIDFDGTSIIVPVAEYRPNSAAIIYRVDPETLAPTEILRFPDHLGGVTVDRANRRLHAVSWGSRRFYAWDLDASGKPVQAAAQPVANPSFYIDYQDCHFAGPARMLCGGLNKYGPDGGPTLALGGLDLVDLDRSVPVHQVPVKLWISPEKAMTNNPYFCATAAGSLDCWFAPEDDATVIYHYRTPLGN